MEGGRDGRGKGGEGKKEGGGEGRGREGTGRGEWYPYRSGLLTFAVTPFCKGKKHFCIRPFFFSFCTNF